MKRILLFIVTNLAVMLVLGIAASLLGVNRYLTANGLNLGLLLGFAAVMGFGGAIISLLISKPMAKWSAKVQIIDGSGSADEAWIVETVRKFADKAGIGMPEVGIFEGDPNAFATGAFKDSALVAVSDGLLRGMTAEEIEAVIRRHYDPVVEVVREAAAEQYRESLRMTMPASSITRTSRRVSLSRPSFHAYSSDASVRLWMPLPAWCRLPASCRRHWPRNCASARTTSTSSSTTPASRGVHRSTNSPRSAGTRCSTPT